MEHHVRRGLAGRGRTFAEGRHAGEEFLRQLTGRAVGLVGHDGHPAALPRQPLQQLRHAGIGPGQHAGVGLIPRLIVPHDGVEIRRILPLRQQGGDQLHRAVAKTLPHLLAGAPGIAVLCHRVVDGGGQIVQRIQQRAVHVKQISLICHRSIPPVSAFAR